MIGRSDHQSTKSTDLLVCFPTRSHLSLAPKPGCSPGRHRRPSLGGNRQLHLRSLTVGGGGQGSPLLWTSRSKQIINGPEEPTSPKVTCAGQIKVRPRSGTCKNWQTVMEEIERIHSRGKQKKRTRSLMESSIGFKKEVMSFLTCLRSIRFDFRCFGAFPQSEITTSEDEEDEAEEEDVDHSAPYNTDESSRTAFSKWFMVLQENHEVDNTTFSSINDSGENKKKNNQKSRSCDFDSNDDPYEPAIPPPNALLLMRCRSAPASKNWPKVKAEKEEEKEETEEEEEDTDIANDQHEENRTRENMERRTKKDLRSLMAEDNANFKSPNNLVVMKYDTDFYKLSSDIAKETWVVGGIEDVLTGSRCCRR